MNAAFEAALRAMRPSLSRATRAAVPDAGGLIRARLCGKAVRVPLVTGRWPIAGCATRVVVVRGGGSYGIASRPAPLDPELPRGSGVESDARLSCGFTYVPSARV